ncbi:MAG: hypothetical protein KBE09_02765 [Candidatus Pacebacteria bacterium]|nr:hypothetical protein [Candidatus Paceibacterota bacterium]
MCNKKHSDATLNGLKPQFPSALNEVHSIWARKPRTIGDHFHELSDRLSASVPLELAAGLRTSDGYEWFAALTCNGEGYSITILLPACESYRNVDGTTTDRMTAVYTQGHCDDASLSAFLCNLAAAFSEIAATRRLAA